MMMQAVARAGRPLSIGSFGFRRMQAGDVRTVATSAFVPSAHLGKFYIGGKWVDPVSTLVERFDIEPFSDFSAK